MTHHASDANNSREERIKEAGILLGQMLTAICEEARSHGFDLHREMLNSVSQAFFQCVATFNTHAPTDHSTGSSSFTPEELSGAAKFLVLFAIFAHGNIEHRAALNDFTRAVTDIEDRSSIFAIVNRLCYILALLPDDDEKRMIISIAKTLLLTSKATEAIQ